jgi:hypothetical protein
MFPDRFRFPPFLLLLVLVLLAFPLTACGGSSPGGGGSTLGGVARVGCSVARPVCAAVNLACGLVPASSPKSCTERENAPRPHANARTGGDPIVSEVWLRNRSTEHDARTLDAFTHRPTEVYEVRTQARELAPVTVVRLRLERDARTRYGFVRSARPRVDVRPLTAESGERVTEHEPERDEGLAHLGGNVDDRHDAGRVALYRLALALAC